MVVMAGKQAYTSGLVLAQPVETGLGPSADPSLRSHGSVGWL